MDIKLYQRMTIAALIVAVLSMGIAVMGALPAMQAAPTPTAIPQALPTASRGGLPLQPPQAFRYVFIRDYILNAGTLTQDGAAEFGSTVLVTGTATLGNVVATTITATNIISNGVGFNATGPTTLVTTTVGTGGVGSLTVHAPATFTDTVTSSGATALNGGLAMDTSAFSVADGTGDTVISGTLTVSGTTSLNGALNMNNYAINNVGNAGTDFDALGGLTLASGLTVSSGGITATINTPNQSGITNLGTQTYFTATNATLTTGTATTLASTYLTSTNPISMAGVTLPWVVSGTQATYTSGASVSFTAPTTPTKCFMNPSPEITATYTITSSGFSVDTTTRSTPIYWYCLQ